MSDVQRNQTPPADSLRSAHDAAAMSRRLHAGTAISPPALSPVGAMTERAPLRTFSRRACIAGCATVAPAGAARVADLTPAARLAAVQANEERGPTRCARVFSSVARLPDSDRSADGVAVGREAGPLPLAPDAAHRFHRLRLPVDVGEQTWVALPLADAGAARIASASSRPSRARISARRSCAGAVRVSRTVRRRVGRGRTISQGDCRDGGELRRTAAHRQ